MLIKQARDLQRPVLLQITQVLLQMYRANKQRSPVAVNEATATFYRALDLSGSHSLWGFSKSLKLRGRIRHSTGDLSVLTKTTTASIATEAFATGSLAREDVKTRTPSALHNPGRFART
ncbi:hypothetical protein AXE65_06965 [Ventosimonas gracilis]|uniref:Uncharacterized protein n=1 Tax=Ventosimonas gracilis TaxID=1680762 RepID=A0A139SJA5_9GAMM|nr:hypothetical protein AXE65_06965 [Ventosimonas gracilis]